MIQSCCLSVLLLFLALPANVVASDSSTPRPFVEGVGGTIRGAEAVVRFTLKNGFPPETVEALKSGIELSFKVRVRVERDYSGWFDPTVGESVFSRSVRYDALSRLYRLRGGKKEEAFNGVLDAIEAMTRYEVAVPLKGDVDPSGRYRANARIRLDRAGMSDAMRAIVFWSSMWDVETSWAKGALTSP